MGNRVEEGWLRVISVTHVPGIAMRTLAATRVELFYLRALPSRVALDWIVNARASVRPDADEEEEEKKRTTSCVSSNGSED